MPKPTQLMAYAAIVNLPLCAILLCQTKHPAGDGADLQQEFDSAQRSQKAGDLVSAAREYRVFLSQAEEELAVGYAGSGDSTRATSLFEAAVAAQPDRWPLRLEYARAELALGNLDSSETQARAMIDGIRDDPQLLAEAHQTLGRALLKKNQDQDARKEMEEAVRLDSTFANSYDLGVVCLDLDDEKCVSGIFGKIVNSFGDTPAIHMQLGLAYGNSDFVPQAIAEFRKVIAEAPKFPEAHYSLAAALLSAGDSAKNIPEAEAALKQELQISPRDFMTDAALGKLAVTEHHYDAAETYLKRATALNPENPDAFLYLGQMEFNQNRQSDAQRALRKAIELTKDPARNRYQIQRAHFLLGRILMEEHHPAEAHAEMAIAQKLANQGLSHDKGELAGLLNHSAVTGVASGADDTGSQALAVPEVPASAPARNSLNEFEKRLTPAIAESYNNLGAIEASQKNYRVALADFEQAAHWNSAIEGLDLNWGRAAFMASRFSEAIPPLTRYVGAHPRDQGVRGALAMSQFLTQDYAGCIATFKVAEDSLASIPQMDYVYAESLVRTGQVNEGLQKLEALEAAHPEIGDVHRSLGRVDEAQGDLGKASREFKTAILLNANDAEAHYELGKIDSENGNAEEAISELEAAEKISPDNPLVHRQLAAAYRLASRNDDAAKEFAVYEHLSKPETKGDGSAPVTGAHGSGK